MGKTIISLKFLGDQNFTRVALEHADRLCDEKFLNKELISLQIQGAKSGQEFKEIFKQHFEEELKLLI